MGKGDRRSRKGKIWRGTYGKTRPKSHVLIKQPFKPKEKVKTK